MENGNHEYKEQLGDLRELQRIVFTDVQDDAISPHEDFTYPVSNMIRMQRSLSWMQRFAEEEVDEDIGFILHWIAFESLYGQDDNSQFTTRDNKPTVLQEIVKFFDELEKSERDRSKLVNAAIEMLDDINSTFANPYISNEAWAVYYKGSTKAGSKHNPFAKAADKFKPYTQSKLKDPHQFNKVIKDLFQRLYLVRNQLFHGNASYKQDKSPQVVSAFHILRKLMPLIVEIMLRSLEDNLGSERWGKVPYPRIKDK